MAWALTRADWTDCEPRKQVPPSRTAGSHPGRYRRANVGQETAMDFTLSDEQRQFQQSVRTFARRELAEKALSRAHDPAYPWDVAHALATHGLLGLTIPAEDGGGGGTLL